MAGRCHPILGSYRRPFGPPSDLVSEHRGELLGGASDFCGMSTLVRVGFGGTRLCRVLLAGCPQVGLLAHRLFIRSRQNQIEDRKSTRLNSSHVAISYAV